VWSAACSTGEEPYTIAMVLSELVRKRRELRPQILASDINREVLARAVSAVYPSELAAPVPSELSRRYLLVGTGPRAGFVRVAPEVRRMVSFRRINLMDGDWALGQSMDVVFCRNVIIYFDRETQRELFQRIYGIMRSGGYLFIGHSESLAGVSEDFTRVGAAVYRKR